MSPAKTKASALERLEELRQAAYRAEQAATATLAERASSERWLPRAQTELAAFLVAVDAGERQPDPAAEKTLRDKVLNLEALRVVADRRGDVTRYADRRTVVRHEQALTAAQEAESERVTFIVEHREQLEAEMLDRSLAARDRLIAAVEELSAARVAWSAVARDWRGLLERWGESPATMPLAALPGQAVQAIELVIAQVRGGARDPRGIIPAPAQLAPGAEHEQRHEAPLRGWESWREHDAPPPAGRVM